MKYKDVNRERRVFFLQYSYFHSQTELLSEKMLPFLALLEILKFKTILKEM